MTAAYLERRGSSSPRLDAELLLGGDCWVSRAISLYAQHDRPLTASELDAYRELVARRAAHEPVAYILGRASFRYLDLEVTPASSSRARRQRSWYRPSWSCWRCVPLLPVDEALEVPAVADVGTGSGAIALSLAKETGIAVAGLDRSEAALAGSCSEPRGSRPG